MKVKILVPVVSVLTFFVFTISGQEIELQNVASGFTNPISIVNDGFNDRIYVVEQDGKIFSLDPFNTSESDPFLDLVNKNLELGGEKGLLGMCFHPDFPIQPYVYLNYTRNNIDTLGFSTIIARFTVDTEQNIAIDSSELVLMEIPQPYSNHNGGDLKFGPDGYLYIALGDGGSGGDPEDRSQNRLTFLGKMLRIDVNVPDNDPEQRKYLIPDTNPFAFDDFTLDEIWALGLRNPWRFSFDGLTGDLYIGDVGQNSWEELDFVPASSIGGENYGWNCFEGFDDFKTSEECPEDDVKPILVYATRSNDGCSITGGYMIRDNVDSPLYGMYVFGDFCSGKIWSLVEVEDGSWEKVLLYTMAGGELSSFGEDKYGNVYVAAHSEGAIYLIAPVKSDTKEHENDEFKIYPNPVNNQLEIDVSVEGYIAYEVFNMMGKSILAGTMDNTDVLSLDMSGVSTGTYIISIKTRIGFFTKKFLVIK